MRGVVRVVIPRADGAGMSRDATGFRGTVAVDVLPAADWSGIPSASAQDELSRSIRATFDPEAILNRGILGAPA